MVEFDEIRGCSEEEVVTLEKHFNLRFPKSYREFLLTMGHSTGILFIDRTIHYWNLFNLRNTTNSFHEEIPDGYKIPENTFLFSVSGDFQKNHYFYIGNGDDPPVFEYVEGNNHAEKISSSFSKYLFDTVTVKTQKFEGEIENALMRVGIQKKGGMDLIVELLVSKNIAKRKEIRGCSEEEITYLEKHFSLSFPKIYRDFLLTLGHGAGDFFIGIDIYYNSLIGIKEGAYELLEECPVDYKIPHDAMVCTMYQGYQFMYFRVSEGENPPVYWYMEGDSQERKIASSFSQYLIKNVFGQAERKEINVLLRERRLSQQKKNKWWGK